MKIEDFHVIIEINLKTVSVMIRRLTLTIRNLVTLVLQPGNLQLRKV